MGIFSSKVTQVESVIGILCDTKISIRLKGKVLLNYITWCYAV